MDYTEPARESFPRELRGDVVMAISGYGKTRWIGTQKNGVLRFGSGPVRRWNPGNGLDDTWVTSLCRFDNGMVVGTMHAGLFRIVGDTISRVASPTLRITQVVAWRGTLVVGGMDGAWVKRGLKWESLATDGEETTSISVIAGQLCVTTNCGAYLL